MGDDLQMLVLTVSLVALVLPSLLSLWKYFYGRRPRGHTLVVRVANKEFTFDRNSFDAADAERLETVAKEATLEKAA